MTERVFEKRSFGKKLKSMLKADFKRMFTMPLVYIMAGIGLAMPVLILVMTAMMGGGMTVDPTTGAETAMEAFTNVWQSLGAVSGASAGMDLTSMCNINLMYFLVAITVCVFVAEEFKSGYAKNLFTVRAKKSDYVVSKTLVAFTAAAIMFVMYFIGAMIGGAIAGLPFDTAGFGAGGIISCFISKVFMSAIFVSIALLLSVAAKQKLWLSVLCSIAAGMLLFMMIPIAAPLDANIVNVFICLAGGGLFAAGLGVASKIVLDKTSLA